MEAIKTPQDVKWTECTAALEPDGVRPFHPATGQPHFIRSKLRLNRRLPGFLGTWGGGRVQVGVSQPCEDSNLTHLVLVWGNPQDLDPAVQWFTQPMYRRRTGLQVTLSQIPMQKKGLIQHPLPLGVWQGILFIRPRNGSITESDQAMLALAAETMSASRIAEPPEEPQEYKAPEIILPGDPRW